MPNHRLFRALACALALQLFGGLAVAAACDPTRQSCAPATGPSLDPGTGGGGSQTCTAAAGGATCDGSGPATQGSTTQTDLGVGNPVNLITGNKYQREVDMPALPGVLGLELVRHYNSQYSLPNVPTGVLGHGWKLSYETELFDTPVGIQIVQADGSRLIFQKSQGDPSHCSSPNPANGTVTIRPLAQGKEYLWHWRGNGAAGGRSLLFNNEGKLVQITAPTGEFVTLLYSSKGWLLQVRDPQGRELNLHYLDAAAVLADPDGSHAFRGVQNIDSPVGRFSYGYGNALPQGSTARSSLTVANLTQVRIPTWYDPSQRTHAFSNVSPSRSSITRAYHYEDPRFPTLLTGISVQGSGSDGVPISQRVNTWGYDGRGKAILSLKGGAADGAEKVTLNNSTPSLTIVTNSLGQTTRYRHANIAGQWRLLESRGAGCAECSPPNRAYGYDKLGRLTEQTTLGPDGKPLRGTRTTLDAQGRPTRIDQIPYANGKPGPAQLQQRFEYAADSDTEPSLIARPSVLAGKELQVSIRYNARGQPTDITESGFEPLKGEAIQRSTHFSYQTLNGNSLLTAIDGPLPNGPKSSPQDSDITRLEWDKLGNYITTVTQPGGALQTITNNPGNGLITQVKNDQGFYTEFVYNTRTQLATLRSGGPGWKQTRVQSMRFDALGNPTERGSGEDRDGGEPFKAESKQGFDAVGRLQWIASALGILTQNRFDTESHLLQTGRYSSTIAQVQNYAYGAQDLPTRVTDALGRDAFASAPSHSLRARQLVDDFGRVVATINPDSGTTTRRFDMADRMVDSTDAKGNLAHYAYDLRGRIQQQTIADASGTPPQTTTWEYQGARLIALHHPTQSERYGYDARGLRTEKITTLTTPQGTFTSVTRYQFDDQGTLQSSSLPDGSQVQYQRNGQGQVTALQREPVRTPWLRWAAPAQTIARDLQRDAVGLKRYTTGNGIEAAFQRSRDGSLARVVYRQTKPLPMQTAANRLPTLLGRSTQELIDLLLGIRTAQAAPLPGAEPGTEPGAIGQPQDPRAFIDHRYLWGVSGNLLHTQSTVNQQHSQADYAYDGQSRLVAAVSPDSVSRYFYDDSNRRVLSQQGASSQQDTRSNTQKASYEPGSHRWTGTEASPTRYDANGQPQTIGQREYVWDALGKLIAIREQDKALASYRYNHRGERVAKTVGTQAQAFLYDNRQLTGELNAQGRLTRQYLYLADQPVAAIDTPEGQALHQPNASALADIAHDLQTIAGAWFGTAPIAWLHTNHLGAPEAVTDGTGKLVWQARYAPFGQATIKIQGFALNLRLPGQYADAETGLFYNRQRYYDPERGQYLTPDPLGTPNGPNGYAYVNYNPLKYVDPDGLVLFAFDGTDNSDIPLEGSRVSNVVLFRDSYDEKANGSARYITGVGTDHFDVKYGNIISKTFDSGLIPDKGGNYSGAARINRMMLYMRDEADAFDDKNVMEIDIVGFSRGAAEARDFANRLAADSNTVGGKTYYTYINQTGQQACQVVNFRFMGLWDTVLSTNRSGYTYNLAIPRQFKYVSQAVALNEYRGAPAGTDAFWTAPINFRAWDDTRIHLKDDNHYGGFPLESIGASSNTPGQVRVERGFIGAHADIGGGYGDDNTLSTVALSWMVGQAQIAGATMKAGQLPPLPTATAVIHDQSNVIRFGDPTKAPATFQVDGIFNGLFGTNTRELEDRQVNGAVSGSTQRTMAFGASEAGGNKSMTNAETHKFITYTPRNNVASTAKTNDIPDLQGVPNNMTPSNKTGTVNMQQYMSWLRSNGYTFAGTQE